MERQTGAPSSPGAGAGAAAAAVARLAPAAPAALSTADQQQQEAKFAEARKAMIKTINWSLNDDKHRTLEQILDTTQVCVLGSDGGSAGRPHLLLAALPAHRPLPCSLLSLPQYLQKICGNVYEHPDEPKYRKARRGERPSLITAGAASSVRAMPAAGQQGTVWLEVGALL